MQKVQETQNQETSMLTSLNLFAGRTVDFKKELESNGIKLRDPSRINAGDVLRALDQARWERAHNPLYTLHLENLISDALIFPEAIENKLNFLSNLRCWNAEDVIRGTAGVACLCLIVVMIAVAWRNIRW